MKIYIVKETTIDEKRVSLVPDVAKKFIKDGFDVFLEKDAGYMSKFTDEDYSSLGVNICLLYTSPSPRDKRQSRMPSSA